MCRNLVKVDAIKGDAATGNWAKSRNGFKDCCLSSTISSDKSDYFTLIDNNRYTLNRFDLAVVNSEIFNFKTPLRALLGKPR